MASSAKPILFKTNSKLVKPIPNLSTDAVCLMEKIISALPSNFDDVFVAPLKSGRFPFSPDVWESVFAVIMFVVTQINLGGEGSMMADHLMFGSQIFNLPELNFIAKTLLVQKAIIASDFGGYKMCEYFLKGLA